MTIAFGGSVSGYGDINAGYYFPDGSAVNNGVISAVGGTLDLLGDISGVGTLVVEPALVELELDDAVGSGQIVEFVGSSSGIFIGGVLAVDDLGDFDATITGFRQGDTIDLTGVPFPSSGGNEGLEAAFDSITGILSIDSVAFGGTPQLLGTLQFSGYTAGETFVLSSDASGGTNVTLGVQTPTLYVLATLDQATYLQQTYTGPGLTIGDYSVFDGTNDNYGMLADAFKDENQVVVAIRGTFPKFTPQLIKNLLSDASWAAGKLGLPDSDPDSYLQQEVIDAANFLYKVRQEFPTAVITLTGHSLGGAVAQLLGLASGYPAIGFNAPGALQFNNSLKATGDLMSATEAGEGASSVDENFRMYGDQVSLAGMPIGNQYTLPQANPDTLLEVLANHSIDTIVTTIQKGDITFASAVTSVPEAPLPLPSVVQPITTVVMDTKEILNFLCAVLLGCWKHRLRNGNF